MKVSVIIPAFNEEKYIGKTLESVNSLEKDNLNIEVLVVDAHSKDKTAEIAESYGAKIISEPHKGIGFARQQGLKHAQGEIVAFTDADTVVPKNWLKRHIEVLQKGNNVFSYGTFRVIDGKFPYFHYINYLQPRILWLMHYLFGKEIAAGQNLAFWREKALSIGGFNDQLKVMEDIDLAVRMSKIGKTVFIPDLVVYSSGRRSLEGWAFFSRMIGILIRYFLFGVKKFPLFPDFR